MKKYFGNILFAIILSILFFVLIKVNNFVLTENIVAVILINFSVVSVILSIALWKKYGDDEPINKVTKKHAPDNINSAELAFFYKGESEISDVMTLLIYLATKGYLKIEEHDENVLFTKDKTFKIIKLKEYDGINLVEKEFFEELFKIGNPEVTEFDLTNKFYRAVNKIEDKIESKKNKKKIFDGTGNKIGILVLVFGLLILALASFLPVFDIYGINGVKRALVCAIFQVIGAYILLETHINIVNKILKVFAEVYYYMISLILLILPAAYMIFGICEYKYYSIAYIVGLVSFIIIMIVKTYMPKRTEFGTKILGEIEGFKEFIQNINNKELEEMVKENKDYFYEILPYAFIFGLYNDWFDKAKLIKLEKPDWYSCDGEFELEELEKELKYLVNIPLVPC